MTMKEFCTLHKITAKCDYADENPYMGDQDNEWARSARHYRVTLRRGRRQFTTFFSQGSAHLSDPTAGDVLGCLLSDASGAEDSFEDWCAEFDYSTDSIRARSTYAVIRQQTRRLKQFLGEHYNQGLTAEW